MLAIVFSIISLIIAICASIWAYKANIIANEANIIAEKPVIRITSLTYYPDRLRIYTSSTAESLNSPLKDKCLPMGPKIYSIITEKNAMRNISWKSFDGEQDDKQYFFINLITEETKSRPLYLYLGALEITLYNDGAIPESAEIINAFSKLPSGLELFPQKPDNLVKENCILSLAPENSNHNRYVYNIAYAYAEGDETSIRFDNLYKFVSETDLIKKKAKARDFINFTESGYVIMCKGKRNTFYSGIVLGFDGNNELSLQYCDLSDLKIYKIMLMTSDDLIKRCERDYKNTKLYPNIRKPGDCDCGLIRTNRCSR